jgi:hypothetical protein
MDKGETFKLLGLGLALILLLLINKFDLLSASSRQALWPRIVAWWQLNRRWFILGGSALLLLVILVPTIRLIRSRQAQAAIVQRVANGPTILLLPRSDWKPVDPGKVNLWARLADALPHDEHVSFEVSGSDVDSFFGLHASSEGLRATFTQIKAEWSGVQSRPVGTGEPGVVEDPANVPEGWSLWWCELTPTTWDKPIEALSDDPLRSVLIEVNGVSGLGKGLLQVIARRDFGVRKRLGQAAFSARDTATPSKGVQAIRRQEAKTFEGRAQKTFLQATIRTVGLADTPERAQVVARGLARAVAASFGASNPVRRIAEGNDPERVSERRMGKAGPWAADELAYLGHLVGGDMQAVAPRLQTAAAQSLPADPEMRILPTQDTARFAELN